MAFKREVPEFNNINDFLICTTAESLVDSMLKSKVFDTSFALSDSDSMILHKMLTDNKHNCIFQKLIELRKVKVDIWRDNSRYRFMDSWFIKVRRYLIRCKTRFFMVRK